ncbi:MAG: carboxylating nicotinate-nucleotide diphosphorylase [Syntrophothermus sp.]
MYDELDRIIELALIEDVGVADITTEAIIPKGVKGRGIFLVKKAGIISGLYTAERVFKKVNDDIVFIPKKLDGSKVNYGDIVAEIEGEAAAILTGERIALNFLQRMSGIATLANEYQQLIKHTKAKIIDTRKTVPGLRILDKYAVKSGGCENHRFGLYDMFLIKDNHISLKGSITNAVEACKAYNKKHKKNFKIEVETTNLLQVQEALENYVDIIMLDNYSVEDMAEAIRFINNRCKVEASGNVNFSTVKAIAETGVDYISIGALTHSVKALDISLEIEIYKED